MKERLNMTVKMQVTPAQALALQAMFKHWNRLAGWGSSRMIGFFVDGDGNFKPKCEMMFSESLPELTDDLEKAAIASDDRHGTLNFDFDGVAWKLHDLPATKIASMKRFYFRDSLGWPVETFGGFHPFTNFMRLVIHTNIRQTWKHRHGTSPRNSEQNTSCSGERK